MDSIYEGSDSESSSASQQYDLDSDSKSSSANQQYESSSANQQYDSASQQYESLLTDSDTIVDQYDVGRSAEENPIEEVMPLKDASVDTSYLGQMFDTSEEAREFYNVYARRWGFGVRIRDSRRDRARDNTLTRISLVCDREGKHVSKMIIQDPERPVLRRNTSTQKCGCTARFVIAIVKSGR